ncbi:MAG: TIGR04283 family arsenosugar biosynthesis glycosyltransferase [Sulfuritalea sp.]|nr:TIGR04283 family arsenosugar biosynthesis glycosyltransferase [Sulfuritalea sp.]MBK9351552.1 TIGR04283 family arsenosugar biosynthesis glycosyltransferase [Sulfuritalea sp.]MBP6637190.1 TIGR04283 family arsenosugar biosynthesis glycosyltransferase [Sulfuritalea sp.]
MRLSIIIPVLDEAERIGGLLAALQAWREQGVEVIVADGGSRDGTPGLCVGLADQVIASARGRAAQMNAGAATSHGDVLFFLHADTMPPADAPTAIAAAIAGGADWGRFDVRIDGTHPLLRVVERMMNWRSRLTGIATGDQAIFVRRATFDAVGGYPAIPLMEDIRLSSTLRCVSSPACLREQVYTSGRRWESRGVVPTILLMWTLRLAFFCGADPVRLARRYGCGP